MRLKPKKMTKMTLEMKPPKSGRVEIRDTISPLDFRVTDRGVRSLSVRTRLHGEQIRINYPGVVSIETINAARAWANDAIASAKQGIDPRIVDKPEIEPASDAFEAVVENFIERYAKRHTKSWKETDRIFKSNVAPKWRGKPINTIRRIDVTNLLDDLEDNSGVYTANRTLAAIRKLFNWHAARDDTFMSPIVTGMARKGEKQRTRTLTDDEIKALWSAWDQMSWPWGDYHKVLLLTMQRKTEVANVRRSHVEDDLWTLPAALTKAARDHTVPLAPAVTAILGELPKFRDIDLYFISGRKGDAPLSGFGRAKAESDKLSGVTGWRLHDLRRTGGDWMKRERVDLVIRKSVLNHSLDSVEGVTGVYSGDDPHIFDEPKRRVLEAWAAHVERIVSGRAADQKVVELSEAR